MKEKLYFKKVLQDKNCLLQRNPTISIGNKNKMTLQNTFCLLKVFFHDQKCSNQDIAFHNIVVMMIISVWKKNRFIYRIAITEEI